MFQRFSRSAREVVSGAVAEAARRGEHRVGTEHLLLGLLHQPWSVAARAVGSDLADARAALDALDRAALAAVGVDLEPAEPVTVPVRRGGPGRLPFTAGARAALARTLHEAARANSRTLEVEHVLLALLDTQPPDPVLALLERLGTGPALVRDRLRAAA